MITLPTGRQIPLYNVSFDPLSQRFFYGSFDVTGYMTRSQKVEVGGLSFDVERANREASDAARDAAGLPRVPEGETSTFTIFREGVADDVSALATGIRDFAGIGPENAGKRSPLFWLVVLGGLGFLAYQLGVFAWVKKKLSA
ncbi:MAG: hypothetical protein ABMA26_16130 [Limisphaerales bacterium]